MWQGDTEVDEGAELTVEHVLAAARADAGLDDFGSDAFLEPLAKLIDCVREEVRFSPAGWLNFKATTQRLLVNRLRLQADLTRHPEILDEDVSDPILVLGMPRTGTTKLQRMMSSDPACLALYTWQGLNPAPLPGERPGDPSGRIAFARLVEEAVNANPDFAAAHETAAEEAEEDSYLLLMTFDYIMCDILNPSPTYRSWVRERPRTPPHRFEKTLLQYLQWQQGGRRGRRWVLKNPGHVGYVDALAEVFPGATLVHTHRDMTEVLPSYCRLLETIHLPMIEDLDVASLGTEALEYWVPEMERYQEQRRRLAGAVDVLDLQYTDVVADAMAAIEQVYDHAGMALTPEATEAMRAWERANPQGKLGTHSYSLERYGLTVERINQAFRDVDPALL